MGGVRNIIGEISEIFSNIVHKLIDRNDGKIPGSLEVGQEGKCNGYSSFLSHRRADDEIPNSKGEFFRKLREEIEQMWSNYIFQTNMVSI